MAVTCTGTKVTELQKRERGKRRILSRGIFVLYTHNPASLLLPSAFNPRKALHEACANGHRDTVEQLLKLGMLDTHKGTYLGGDTPLHLAVSSGERSLVFLLLRHRCDPNLPNKFGATCFHYADRQPAIAKLLLR